MFNDCLKKWIAIAVILHLFIGVSFAQGIIHTDQSKIQLKDNWQYRFSNPETELHLTGKQLSSLSGWKDFNYPTVPENRNGRNYLLYKVTLPDQKFNNPTLFFPSLSLDIEIYIGDNKIYQFGDLRIEDKGKYWGWRRAYFVPLPKNYQGRQILFKMTSTYHRIGIKGDVFVGPREDHIKAILQKDLAVIFLGLLFCVLAIIALMFYAFNRSEVAYLGLSIIVFTVGIFVITKTQMRDLWFDYPIKFAYLEIFSVLFAPMGLSLYVQYVIGPGPLKIIKKCWELFLVYGLVSVALCLYDPFYLSKVIPPFNVLVLIWLLILIIFTLCSAYKGNFNARIFFSGLIIMALYSGYDALVSLELIEWHRPLFHWGMLFFVSCLCLIIIRVFNQSLSAVKEQKRLELELQTASLVQSFLIPKEDPELKQIEFSSFYSSASETGGDWYDYRVLSDQKIINIKKTANKPIAVNVLIGDVTGHGVPAALITAMVNSYFLSIKDDKNTDAEGGKNLATQPATQLERLSDILYATTEGLFTMTFFNSIIDLKTMNLHYSSAGHTPTIIFRESGFDYQQGGKTIKKKFKMLHLKGRRLAEKLGSSYLNKSIQLKKNDILVWYTDGLNENMNKFEEMFGLKPIKNVLEQYQHKSANDIKDIIVEKAYNFYDKQPIEDDITLIVAKIN